MKGRKRKRREETKGREGRIGGMGGFHAGSSSFPLEALTPMSLTR